MSRIEKLADYIYVLTDVVEIDDRITWHIPGTRGFEPYNEYLIMDDERAILVDSGIALHGDSILASLRELIGVRQLHLYATRIELECLGNHGRILDAFPNAKVVTANVVPQAALFHVSGFRATTAPVRHMQMGDTLAEFGFPDIKIHQAPLRMLGTSWLWEKNSRTLFTTDSFNTDMLDNPSESVLRRDSNWLAQPDFIRNTLLQKFDWLALADMEMIERDWDALFAQNAPLAIAPIHGRIQMGADHCQHVIANHRAALFGQNDLSKNKSSQLEKQI